MLNFSKKIYLINHVKFQQENISNKTMLNFNKKINLINHVTFQQENISNKPFSITAIFLYNPCIVCPFIFINLVLSTRKFLNFIVLVLSALFLYSPCIVCPF